MKKVLITGISGFLGSNTAKLFSEKDFEVFGVDICDYKFERPVKFYKTDISSEKLKELNTEFDYIIHCAGGSTVGQSINDPLCEFHKTVNTTAEVLEYMRKYNKNAKLIYPSSAAVYGNSYSDPIKESFELNPISPYGFYKKMTEDLCDLYYKNFGVKSNIIRFFSIYGEELKKQLLWDVCNKFYLQVGNIEFFGTGEEVRDWIYIQDAVELIYKTALNADDFGIINGGTGEGIKVKKIIKSVSEKLNNKLDFSFNNQMREGDPKCFIANTEKQNSVGWKQTYAIEQGIENYVRWFKSQN